MATVDFSSGYRDATKGATLKALQKRQDDQAAVTALVMKPREIGSMWQGAAQIGDVISGSIREGRLANQEAAGRARFAELLAGGLAPDEIGEAMGLDPETTMKWQERNWAQEDLKETRAIAERNRLQDRGWSVEDADRRVREQIEQEGRAATQEGKVDTRELGQTIAAEGRATDATIATEGRAAGRETEINTRELEETKAKEIRDAAAAKIVADDAAKTAAAQAEHTAALQDPRARLALSLREGVITQDEYKAGIDAINREEAKKATPPGLDQLNRDTAKEALDWKTIGASTAASNQANIDEAIKTLETPGIMGQFGDTIGLGKTGAVAGMLPPGMASVLNPSGEKAAAAVQTAVQSSLKLILGSQFAQNEGEQLLKRAFDKSMPPTENARRAKMVKAQLQQAAEAKEQFVKYYFDNNYNMDGYQGPNLQQIQADFNAKTNAGLDAMDAEAGGTPDAAAAPSEEDITETMRANNMTREQVLAELKKRQGGG